MASRFGRLGGDVDDVGGDVAALLLQPLDLGRIGGQHLFSRRILAGTRSLSGQRS